MDKIYLLQPYRKGLRPISLFPCCPLASLHSLVWVYLCDEEALYHVTASSAIHLSVNISCRQPCRPGGTVETCWRVFLLVLHDIWKLPESWENTKGLGKEKNKYDANLWSRNSFGSFHPCKLNFSSWLKKKKRKSVGIQRLTNQRVSKHHKVE